jgi:hypothetical protein
MSSRPSSSVEVKGSMIVEDEDNDSSDDDDDVEVFEPQLAPPTSTTTTTGNDDTETMDISGKTMSVPVIDEATRTPGAEEEEESVPVPALVAAMAAAVRAVEDEHLRSTEVFSPAKDKKAKPEHVVLPVTSSPIPQADSDSFGITYQPRKILNMVQVEPTPKTVTDDFVEAEDDEFDFEDTGDDTSHTAAIEAALERAKLTAVEEVLVEAPLPVLPPVKEPHANIPPPPPPPPPSPAAVSPKKILTTVLPKTVITDVIEEADEDALAEEEEKELLKEQELRVAAEEWDRVEAAHPAQDLYDLTAQEDDDDAGPWVKSSYESFLSYLRYEYYSLLRAYTVYIHIMTTTYLLGH